MTTLITGGGGFLGGEVIRQLLARGDRRLRSLSRQTYPSLQAAGVEQFAGDLTDVDAVDRAVRGCERVFHVAARAGVWGRWRDFYDVNVTGTENLLAAARIHGVRQFIFTSSPSVVHGSGAIEGADESLPYPARYETYYPQTKAMAERAVLAANGPALKTVALRPHLIWGPGDPHLIPRVLARARAGTLRRIGRGDPLVDTVHVENAALAHLLAADALDRGDPVAGKAYFITNGEPRPLWGFIDQILAAHRLPRVTRSVPFWLAYSAGALMEWAYRVLGRRGEPPMTRFVARQLSHAHWYSIAAARRDLGYTPRVSIDEGLSRLAQVFHP